MLFGSHIVQRQVNDLYVEFRKQLVFQIIARAYSIIKSASRRFVTAVTVTTVTSSDLPIINHLTVIHNKQNKSNI